MTDPIPAVRDFNRFYTRHLGLLDDRALHAGLSLVEARLIFELAQAPARPGDLARDLAIDPGYLSRIVERFERRGLTRRTKGVTDKRSWTLSLTPEGEALFQTLDAASTASLAARLKAASPDLLVQAMGIIRAQLDQPAPATLRPLQTGDLGWIAHRQSLIYAAEYGFDQSYEALIARILAEFHSNFKPGRESAWVAESRGAVVGSVFVVRETDQTARLRLLYVEPHLRGQGLGRRLVRDCTAFARAAGYGDMVLWTQNNLTAARAIYAGEGYHLEKSEPHRSFGVDLVGETWRLAL